MGDSFTIQISSNLVKQLADDGEKKKKTRKLKTKVPQDPQPTHTKVHPKQVSDDSEKHKGAVAAGWPLQRPLFLPVSPSPQPANEELDAIRSLLQETEKVVERLQKQEEDMVQEVTQRSRDLHEKEFKLPNRKPMPCLAEKDACFECYKEHVKDPLKCAHLVENFANCARRVRQEVSSADK